VRARPSVGTRREDRHGDDAEHEFGHHVVVDAGGHGHVHGECGGKGGRAQRDDRLPWEEDPNRSVAQGQADQAQGDREESQREESWRPEQVGERIHACREHIVEGRLVRLVANRVNRHLRRKTLELDLLEIRDREIARLQHR